MRSRLIRHGTILVVLGAMAAGTVWLLDKEFEWRAREPEREGSVKTASGKSDLPCVTVTLGKFTITVATGVVEPARTEDVMCPVQGRAVVHSMLPEGTLVEKGRLVCELDSSSLGDRLAGPRVTGKKADDAVNLPDQVERFPLYAPADGTLQWASVLPYFQFVDRPRVKPGDTVSKGQRIFQLYDQAGPMRVRTKVLEEAIDQIRTGMPARIRLVPFPEPIFKGTVREIAVLPGLNYSFADGPKFYDTLVSLDGGPPGPRPGMRATVEILVNDLDNVLSVPREAALSFYGKDLAAVKRSDGGFDWREIILGARTERLAEVKRGLRSGDCVCLKPYALMRAQENARHAGLPSPPVSR